MICVRFSVLGVQIKDLFNSRRVETPKFQDRSLVSLIWEEMVDGPAEGGQATGVQGTVIRKMGMKVDVSAAQVEKSLVEEKFFSWA